MGDGRRQARAMRSITEDEIGRGDFPAAEDRQSRMYEVRRMIVGCLAPQSANLSARDLL
jgi:hypothetical protein